MGRAPLKIWLDGRDGDPAVQCHRLDQKYAALFRAQKEGPSLVPSEAKPAALVVHIDN
jgi:hypothetical protein